MKIKNGVFKIIEIGEIQKNNEKPKNMDDENSKNMVNDSLKRMNEENQKNTDNMIKFEYEIDSKNSCVRLIPINIYLTRPITPEK